MGGLRAFSASELDEPARVLREHAAYDAAGMAGLRRILLRVARDGGVE